MERTCNKMMILTKKKPDEYIRKCSNVQRFIITITIIIIIIIITIIIIIIIITIVIVIIF